MSTLKEKLASQIPTYRERVKNIAKDHGDTKISDVSIAQLYGGMRGVKGLICDTSVVDPEKGVIYRGYPVADCVDRLPEEIFYLLLTGEMPDAGALKSLQDEIASRSEVPGYVWDTLRALPKDSHPMAMYNLAILAMQRESQFAKRYEDGMPKEEYWEPALDDALTLLGVTPSIAAGVYRILFGDGTLIEPDTSLDMGAKLVHEIGTSKDEETFTKLTRLFLTLHADHESGNASAFTTHTVASTLSDPFYSYCGGLNALAGPLHGRANQDAFSFVLKMIKEFGDFPNEEQASAYVWDALDEGKVVPGYGHAVLRATDPRFTALYEFGEKYCPDASSFKAVWTLFQVVPDILQRHGKASNPWPNVDAVSGSLLYHFGVTETSYYTVLFGVARAIGVLSQLVLSRGMGAPIMRPKSVSTDWVERQLK